MTASPLRAIPGMRHFAGSGPHGEYCVTCAHGRAVDWGRTRKGICSLVEAMQKNPSKLINITPLANIGRAENDQCQQRVGGFLMARSITIEQAAAEMSVSPETVRKLLHDGQLRGHRVRRCLRIFVDSLEAYQLRNQIQPSKRAAQPRKTNRRAHDDAVKLLTSFGI